MPQYPTFVTIQTGDPVLIKHLMNCLDRKTNFRINKRQFKVTEFISSTHIADLTVYTFKLYEAVQQ